jgi:hypothetical protein
LCCSRAWHAERCQNRAATILAAPLIVAERTLVPALS